MLCPEVWSFDSPGFNATEKRQVQWNEATKRKLFNNIETHHGMNEMVTVILPNCKEEDQERIKSLVQERGSSYTVHNLSLADLISPLFIEGFVKRGKFVGLSVNKDPDSSCIVSLSANGQLSISLDKEVFQSIPLEGKPVQSSRKQVDKYLCTVNLLDDNLLKTTKVREVVQESLGSALLPKISLQFKWEPPSIEICASSAAKYFSDQSYEVVASNCEIKCREDLSRRLASFSDLSESQEIFEYLGMLALNCSEIADEYLNSYEYAGEMIRVKNMLVLTAKGCLNSSDIQAILDAALSCLNETSPWIAMYTLGFTRTPFCERFFEDFYDISSERAFTFLLNNKNESLVQQILPIVKRF